MANSDAILVLQNMLMSVKYNITEKEALEKAIDILEKEEDIDA